MVRMEAAIAQDLRNQKIINRLKTPPWRMRLMERLNNPTPRDAFLANIVLWVGIVLPIVFMFLGFKAFATECPSADPCRVLILTPQEEKALTAPNGVLDTAAQGRALELGQFVVYLKQRIATSPMGEPKPAEKPVEAPKP